MMSVFIRNMVLHTRNFAYVIGIVLSLSVIIVNGDDDLTFPEGFVIGAASAAYQIEGGWNASDKGENVWDRYTHSQPDRIKGRGNGDIACDSFHKYKEDIQLLKELGVDYYRFSLSWTRILPTGYSNVVSKDGVKYYNDILDELERNNIEPLVTIYHWDHPQVFQDIGGWTNEVIVDLFGDYARVVFKEFGHRVKLFVTINEPNIMCENAYYKGNYPPGLKTRKHAEYLCSHNIIKSHARAYHIYNDEFKAQQQGKIGIVINFFHFYSKYENDTFSNEMAFQYQAGRYANPIFSKTGDYPDIIKKRIAENSKYEGLATSRLPVFSQEWIDYIRGSADYLGVNHYGAMLVEPAPKPNNTLYENDDGLIYSFDPNWPNTPVEVFKIIPDGFKDILIKLNEEYENPLIYVTESGISDVGTLDDTQRIEYFHTYLKAMLVAIKEYGCNVKGYTIWSLLDDFEWESGYTVKFGLYHVDFNSPNRTRTPKKSVSWISKVLRSRTIQPIDTKE